MQPVFKEKREVATLIPYIQEGDSARFFLQRRDKHARRLPDRYGFFGGGLEAGENPETAMLREIKEELVFVPEGFVFFNRYEFLWTVNHVYILKVGNDFESTIEIREGQYGKWFTLQDALAETRLDPPGKLILIQLTDRLNGKL